MPPATLEGSAARTSLGTRPALFCFSHLRWNFVYQRPQHLLTRAARFAEIYFFEEPLVTDAETPSLQIEHPAEHIHVLTPLLPRALLHAHAVSTQRALLDHFLAQHKIEQIIAWYYTPMSLLFSDHLHPQVVVYDCMDQLSAFDGAPPELVEQEKSLFARADVVFTGGRSLYEEKRGAHANVHLFPSSVDREHFASARQSQAEPEDQRAISHPRIGFFGVLDERLDRELLAALAAREPLWHFVLIGPVVKISEDSLPRAANIYYLGKKQYDELPAYLAHWDVAMLPFALNASTRFISPTKTPEYLSAGRPVVSTAVPDVVEPYGRLGLARIGDHADTFRAAIQEALEPPTAEWLSEVDRFLNHTSWDKTFRAMWEQVEASASQASTYRAHEEAGNV